MAEGAPLALIDTSVWISAFIAPDGPPARVVTAFRQQRFVPVISPPLIAEIMDVAHRPRIRRRRRITDEDLALLLVQVREEAIEVIPIGTLRLCRDPQDDFLLETAILGKALYVVSRDEDLTRDRDLVRHLGEHGIAVVTVARFLELLDSREG